MKHSGIPLSSLSPKLRAQIEAQEKRANPFFELKVGPGVWGKPVGLDTSLIRQRRRKGSKTQDAFAEFLKSTVRPGVEILEEKITVELANGVRFTPDFCLIGAGASAHLTFYEVKGGYAREDAKIKLKIAARVFPSFAWFLAHRKGRASSWSISRVLP